MWKMQGLHFFCEEFTSDSVLNTLLFLSLSKYFHLKDARIYAFYADLNTLSWNLTFEKNHVPWLSAFFNSLGWIVCDLKTVCYMNTIIRVQWNKRLVKSMHFTSIYLHNCYFPIEDDKCLITALLRGDRGHQGMG